MNVPGAMQASGVEIEQAPVAEQHAPTRVEDWQKVVVVHVVPEVYPMPAPSHTLAPVQPLKVVAEHVPVAEQQAPRMAVVWQSVVEVQAPAMLPTPEPWNMEPAEQPLGVVTKQVPVPVQHAPSRGEQGLSGVQTEEGPMNMLGVLHVLPGCRLHAPLPAQHAP